MLVELTLENFRCFRKHTIPLRSKSIIVGRNNAGKSTIVEALRLVAIVSARYKGLAYNPAPRWLDLHKSIRGVSPSLNEQVFNFEKAFHRYGDPPATIIARFDDSSTISVYIGPNNAVFAVLRGARKQVISSRSMASASSLPTIGILPQVAPLRNVEKVLDPDYVRECLFSNLAPKHFRNQLFLQQGDFFQEFKTIAEDTWHGLRIEELKRINARQPIIELMVRNEDFVAEVSWMGHGLQMWLQTMWFLARCKNYDTVILDEPDVYMHADLQRRLIRLLHNRHKQVIIATHSVEIMSEVEPKDILIVDKERREAKFASDIPEVQQIISHVGGVHNLQLTRLVSSAKCLFVEGDDMDILRKFHARLFPNSLKPIENIPNLSIGGWSGWKEVVGSSMWIEKTTGGISIYCILDSDYFTPEQIAERFEQARRKNVRLHIWRKKEIENYLLVPNALHRALLKSNPGLCDEASIREKLCELAEKLKATVTDSIAEQIGVQEKKGVKSANEKARFRVDAAWRTFEGKLSIVPGKTILSDLNRWAQAEYKASFTNVGVAMALDRDEIAVEIVDLLNAFEENEPL